MLNLFQTKIIKKKHRSYKHYIGEFPYCIIDYLMEYIIEYTQLIRFPVFTLFQNRLTEAF